VAVLVGVRLGLAVAEGCEVLLGDGVVLGVRVVLGIAMVAAGVELAARVADFSTIGLHPFNIKNRNSPKAIPVITQVEFLC
jgi:hypothetical protein